MKVTIDIKNCYQCPFVKTYADHPVSDDGIVLYDYRCGGVKFPQKTFEIVNKYEIHKNCPFRQSKKKKIEKEEQFIINPKSELGKFIKNFKGRVSPEARKFFTEYAVEKPKRSARRTKK